MRLKRSLTPVCTSSWRMIGRLSQARRVCEADVREYPDRKPSRIIGTIAMRPPVALAALLLALVSLSGCGPSGERKEAAKPRPEEPKPVPDVFEARLETSKGEIVIEVHKDWAQHGAGRFWDLIHSGFYDGARFYRVVRGYVAQFGYNGNPQIDALWQSSYLPDDPVKQSNKRGYVSFAQERPGTRTTQVFLNLRDNTALDKSGFAPFGRVTSGMDVADSLWLAYGDLPPRGTGPDPILLGAQGNAYLRAKFPRLDYIKKAAAAEKARAP
jgi:peptidyl-prolyl cis-trans isomerase A (cyclophilin A)